MCRPGKHDSGGDPYSLFLSMIHVSRPEGGVSDLAIRTKTPHTQADSDWYQFKSVVSLPKRVGLPLQAFVVVGCWDMYSCEMWRTSFSSGDCE